MKKSFSAAVLAALMLAPAPATEARSALDLSSRATLRHLRTGDTLPQKNIVRARSLDGVAEGRTALGMLRIAPGYTRADLESAGYRVFSVRGDIALVSMPVDSIELLAEAPCVSRVQLAKKVRPAMDLAREASGVSKIHAGTDLPKAYTGKGVVAGVVDQGLDPNHINFRTGDDYSQSRIGFMSHIYQDSKSQSGWTEKLYDRNNISSFTTDATETYHGTHTLGILAGSYRGTVTAAEKADAFTVNISDVPNPYYGVAPDADIATSCGDLVDMLIGLGIENIINYAAAEGKPCVLSLSLGSTTGPHDPNSLMCQFLDLAADYAIICLSAGNEGDLPIAIRHTAETDGEEVKTFIEPYAYSSAYGNIRYGQVYIYSDSPEGFDVQAVIYNKSRGSIAYRMPILQNQEEGVPQYYSSSKEDDTDIVTTTFSNAFSGYVGIGYMHDEYTGRYFTLLDYYTVDNSAKNAAGNYILGFVCTPKAGQTIEAYCDGVTTCFNSYGQEGWIEGSTDGSLSDMAYGYRPIVVGSYNTRDDWGSLSGETGGYDGAFKPGKVSSFSSYATLSDGRTLPHVCAPGAAVISSTNSYYVEDADNYVGESDIQAIMAEENRRNYWQQSIGTSMSTPYVAGAIALWLEADPTLNDEDVRRIIAGTAIRDSDVEEGEPARWGAGKFDAYAGLKEVLRSSGLQDVSASDKNLLVQLTGDNRYEVFLPGARQLDIRLHAMTGAAVINLSASGDQATVDASALTPGVYTLSVNGQHCTKLLIK